VQRGEEAGVGVFLAVRLVEGGCAEGEWVGHFYGVFECLGLVEAFFVRCLEVWWAWSAECGMQMGWVAPHITKMGIQGKW
jgi:hypothetical protein